ncbi:hypothetical protein F0562_026655 [Nyssa sinensis]|uniref:Uncharacterized protein n=1 Tax=Nyssa sinensis TaxID=561372 RepID=A0A5J5B9Z2_9ASTE|nr:hypothetical protein F0562_026655 [Nyssa sinensis]
MKNPYLPTRTSKLHAGAKGFNGASANTQKEKSTSKETVSRKSFGSDDGDDDDKIPEVVMERMIVRILSYVGVPLITGIAFLQVFGIVKEQNLWDVPLWLPALTTFITFGASALGIAYGTLSTSWDPEKKGSVLGFEEAQKNWVEMWREEEDSKSLVSVE